MTPRIKKKLGNSIKETTELSPKALKFAKYLVEGTSQVEAYFKAGYMAGMDQKSQAVRERAYRHASALKRNAKIQAYVEANKNRKVTEYGRVDIPELAEHLKSIAFGTALILRFDRNGNEHMEPPSFKEQIMAGKELLSIHKDFLQMPEQNDEVILGERLVQLECQLTDVERQEIEAERKEDLEDLNL